jgi:predicted hydrocarbon binding protein
VAATKVNDQSATIPIEDLTPRWSVKTQRGERLLTFRADAWNQMRNDLITLTGEKVARQILYRIGMSMAKSANRLEQTRINNGEEYWKVADELFQERGWGHILSHEETIIQGPKTNSYKIVFEDSAFADVSNTQHPPVCDLLRGLLGNWMALQKNRALLSTLESSCKAMGPRHCTFLVELGPVNTISNFAAAFGT